MSETAHVRIRRQADSVAVSELEAFLQENGTVVDIEAYSPGPQMSVDWFNPAALDVVFNLHAAHPYLAAWLGGIGGVATSKIAAKVYEKVADKIGDKLLDKVLDPTLDKFVGVFVTTYKSAKAAGIRMIRGSKSTPVPPVKLTFPLDNRRVEKKSRLELVFPADLNDADVREALTKVGKVVDAANTREEWRADIEEKATELFRAGRTEEASAMVEGPDSLEFHRTQVTYAYRPQEKAWVDAFVLADEDYQKTRAQNFKKLLDQRPVTDVEDREMIRQLIVEIEERIKRARIA